MAAQTESDIRGSGREVCVMGLGPKILTVSPWRFWAGGHIAAQRSPEETWSPAPPGWFPWCPRTPRNSQNGWRTPRSSEPDPDCTSSVASPWWTETAAPCWQCLQWHRSLLVTHRFICLNAKSHISHHFVKQVHVAIFCELFFIFIIFKIGSSFRIWCLIWWTYLDSGNATKHWNSEMKCERNVKCSPLLTL